MRAKFDKVIRAADGRANPAAQVSFFLRNRIDVPLPAYDAETGGSAVTQPITPDADGKVDAWLDATSSAFSNYSVLINHGGGAVQFLPFDLFPQRLDAWTALTLAGAWSNVSGTASYLRTAEGLVIVKGLVTGGAASSTIATLPAGYRPSASTNFSGIAGTTAVSLGVDTAGAITAGATAANTSLDNIIFPVA